MEYTKCYQDCRVEVSAKPAKDLVNLLLSKFELFSHRYHTRNQLKNLSAEQLIDMGLSQEQVKIESQKPFWK